MSAEASPREKNVSIPLPASNGPRPYRCEICQRSFREVATLRKHEQLHRADRPYVCQTCGKSFLWSSNLKVHERVHTGERPYKCKICHRCFTQSNDLRRHERNVHMRGKLYSYKSPPAGRAIQPAATNPAQMNLAAYQAFALQQRAILQHALTYESLMQSSVSLTTAHYLQSGGGRSLASLAPMGDVNVSTSVIKPRGSSVLRDPRDQDLPQDLSDRSLKLEQVTPPPADDHFSRGENSADEHQSPGQSGYSPTSNKSRYSPTSNKARYSPSSNKAHSPPAHSTSAYGLSLLPNGSRSSHSNHAAHLGSPEAKRELPFSHCESHAAMEYQKYFRYPTEQNAFARSYNSAFSSTGSNRDLGDSGIMDLRINKSNSSVESEDGELDWKHQNTSLKSPASGSDSDSKRDVTTTSLTPTVESGIHHCTHCNIVFHDFTMYNLHQSLHSPMEDDPFMCPSCMKHCQDRIEFMFHIVWHVKYPHTIPRYQSFKESYLMMPEPDEITEDGE